MTTHAITLKQPWAWAVIYAGKDIENRTRAISPCDLVIHAGKGWDEEGEELILEITGRSRLPKIAMRGGFIIGRVSVTGATFGSGRGRSKSPWAFRGTWNWHLENPEPADPVIVCRGYPSLWYPPKGWERSFRRTA